MNDAKRRILDLATRYVCAGRVRTFEAMGVDLVIGRREGYRIWDIEAHELLDYHLNGGVFNLGHRNRRSWRRCTVRSRRSTLATITSRASPAPSSVKRWRA